MRLKMEEGKAGQAAGVWIWGKLLRALAPRTGKCWQRQDLHEQPNISFCKAHKHLFSAESWSQKCRGRVKALNANLLLTLSVSSSSSSCSEEEPEGTLPKDKLITLCKYEPILKWMRSCDHILYQALVEILIPDVLRPVPSEYPQPHLGT